MNILTWIILVLAILIIVALVLNQKFNLIGKYRGLRESQKKYDSMHDKYKKLLDD